MTPIISARTPDREEIERLTAEFLARGGDIKRDTTRSIAVPWGGNMTTGRRALKTAAYLASTLRMSAEKFEVMAKEPTFPVCYIFNAERTWCASDVRKWHTKYRKDM